MNKQMIVTKLQGLWAIVVQVFTFLRIHVFNPVVKHWEKNSDTYLSFIFWSAIISIVTHLLLTAIWGYIAPAASFTGDAPGSTVMILSGKSVLDDEGYTCQQWTRGKIAPTSPEGEQKWHKVGQFWFPLSYSVSVIDTATGEVKWVSSKILAPYESSDYTYKTCDDAINDPVDN